MKTKMEPANYLSRCIALSGKKIIQISEEVGFDSPNVISMMKNGQTKIPIARIPALAKALGTDPKVMLDVCLEAYQPEIYGVLSSLTPSMLISTGELAVIRLLRRAIRAGVIT